MLLAIACAVGVAIVDWLGISVSLPVAGSSTTAGLAVVALLLVLYRVINPVGGDDVEREPALWIGLACLVGLMLGAFVGMWEDHPPKTLAEVNGSASAS
jgi:hypothetical protein